MILKSRVADFLLRVAVGMLIGALFGFLVSEVTYRATPNKQDSGRSPQQFTLVIPYGTAAQIKEGVGNRSLPTNMDLVQGDILIVRNEDVVAHQLGPLFVPPKTASVLSLEKADDYSYACTFNPTKTFGLNVKSSLDAGQRVLGSLTIGLPTGMMLAIYSYMIDFDKWRKKKDPAAETAKV